MNVDNRQYPEKPEAVYFYGTCLVDMFYPEAGMAGINLIEREGVKVHFPQAQTCCGQPPYNSGFDDEARQIAKQQLALFSKPIPVVVPSGSCAAMMKHHYPSLFANTPWEHAAKALAERVFELSEFLVKVLKVKLEDKGAPITIALHTSCSARREMGVAEDGKALLAQLAQVELKQQARETECCGFGGTFAVKAPEISAAMVADKCQCLAETKAQALLSGDCGCLMNISGAMQYQQEQEPRKLAMDSAHLATFLWERTQ